MVAEELGDVVGEQRGFLVCGEMPAAWHGRVSRDVVGAFGPAAGRVGQIGGEQRQGRGDGHLLDAPGQSVGVFVVRPERRRDRPGEPVERGLSEQEVVAEPARHVTVAVAPRPVLLEDPGQQPGRRVGQAVAQSQWPRALFVLVSALVGGPRVEGFEVRLLLGGEAGGVVGHRVGDGHQVDADDVLRIRLGQSGGDARAEVAAVRGVAIEAEFVVHQPMPELVCAAVRKRRTLRRESEARKRRDDDGERVGCVAAVARRRGKALCRPDQLEE